MSQGSGRDTKSLHPPPPLGAPVTLLPPRGTAARLTWPSSTACAAPAPLRAQAPGLNATPTPLPHLQGDRPAARGPPAAPRGSQRTQPWARLQATQRMQLTGEGVGNGCVCVCACVHTSGCRGTDRTTQQLPTPGPSCGHMEGLLWSAAAQASPETRLRARWDAACCSPHRDAAGPHTRDAAATGVTGSWPELLTRMPGAAVKAGLAGLKARARGRQRQDPAAGTCRGTPSRTQGQTRTSASPGEQLLPKSW